MDSVRKRNGSRRAYFTAALFVSVWVVVSPLASLATPPALSFMGWYGGQELVFINGERQFRDGTALSVSPDGKSLYFTQENSYHVFAYSLDPSTGRPSPLGDVVSRFDKPCTLLPSGKIAECPWTFGALAFSPDGLSVYASLIDDRRILNFRRDPLTGMLMEAGDSGDQSNPGCFTMAVSPDGKNVYAGSWTALYVHSRDPDTGQLTPIQSLPDEGENNHVTSVAISPDGRSVYTVSGYHPLNVYQRDTSTGALTLITSYQNGDGGVVFTNGGGVHLSPDGLFVYAGDNIAARDPVSGTLSFVSNVPSAGNASVSTDGLSAWIGASYYMRDILTGALTPISSADPYCPSGAQRLGAISPDGQSYYTLFSSPTYTTGLEARVGWYKVDGLAQCGAVPNQDCAAPASSLLSVMTDSEGGDHKLSWKWSASDAQAEFGNPTQETDYILCFYDDITGSKELKWSASVPSGLANCRGGDAWYVVSQGYQMRTRDENVPSGIARVKMRTKGSGGKAVSVSGKGRLLSPRMATSVPVTVVVQLVNNEGQCWQAEYTKNDVLTNTGGQYKARMRIR